MIGLWECYEIEDSDEWCEFCGEERPCECDEQMMEGEFDENYT